MAPESHRLGPPPPEAGRLLQSLLKVLPGAAFRCLNDTHWTLLYLSEEQGALLGGEVGAPQAAALLPLVQAEDRDALRAAVKALTTDGERFDCEFRVRDAAGLARHLQCLGRLRLDRAQKTWLIEGFIADITERKRAESALREAEQRYYGIFNNSPDGIFRTTPEGRYLIANTAMARILGFESPEQLIAEMRDIGLQQYVETDKRTELRLLIETHGQVRAFECQVFRRNGDVIWIAINAQSVLDAEGEVQFYEGTVEDITERRIYQAEVERQANYDSLTGLANRTLLRARLEKAIRAAQASATGLAVVFMDLDQFKNINDSYGHQLGDALLLTVSERLKASVRGHDTVARLGGDEFVLLLQGIGNQAELELSVSRIRATVSQPWQAERREFGVSCSMGVAVFPADGRSADVLLRNADAAMYKAKELGRNNHQYFTAELNHRLVERMAVEQKLRNALTEQQLAVYYQPRVEARSGRVVGAEALLRWQLPDAGMIAPGRFIHIAEESGLIVPIGQWVLETACAQAKSWQVAGLPATVVSVNVSPRQFRQSDMVATIDAALRRSALPPSLLQIELTEGLSMHDADRYIQMLTAIKALGVQIAVDDFGTGYSSLNYLKRFPIDHLKVDRSFVKDMVSDPDDAAIVQAIIALGHKLGLKLVAEGVENEAQLELLRRCACDELQGYLFGRPMSAEQFAVVLSAQAETDTQLRATA